MANKKTIIGEFSESATADSFVKRDSAGRIKAADPAAAGDLLTKNYFDNNQPAQTVTAYDSVDASTAAANGSLVAQGPCPVYDNGDSSGGYGIFSQPVGTGNRQSGYLLAPLRGVSTGRRPGMGPGQKVYIKGHFKSRNDPIQFVDADSEILTIGIIDDGADSGSLSNLCSVTETTRDNVPGSKFFYNIDRDGDVQRVDSATGGDFSYTDTGVNVDPEEFEFEIIIDMPTDLNNVNVTFKIENTVGTLVTVDSALAVPAASTQRYWVPIIAMGAFGDVTKLYYKVEASL